MMPKAFSRLHPGTAMDRIRNKCITLGKWDDLKGNSFINNGVQSSNDIFYRVVSLA